MLRRSLIAAAFALAAVSLSAAPGSAATANASGTPHHRTVVHRVYTYEPAPSPYYYGPYYGPSYAPAYAPAAPIDTLPGAAVCLAFSLIGAGIRGSREPCRVRRPFAVLTRPDCE